MAGVKGKSGRRARSVEEKRYAIIDKAWEVLYSFLKSDVSLKDKVDVAIKVAVKDMPADTVIDQSEHNHFIFKWKGKKIDRSTPNRDRNRLLPT